MINLLSAGEITVGMYITCYEWIRFERVSNPFTGEWEDKEVLERMPCLKGIPYEVCGVAGPIIAVKTLGKQGMVPIVFFDSRWARFIEVNKEYHDDYYRIFDEQNKK